MCHCQKAQGLQEKDRPQTGVLQRAGFRNLSLYLTGTNLLTLSDLIEGDPKSTTFTTGFYPMMTSVKLGVKIGF